jgi:hypothetical protein
LSWRLLPTPGTLDGYVVFLFDLFYFDAHQPGIGPLVGFRAEAGHVASWLGEAAVGLLSVFDTSLRLLLEDQPPHLGLPERRRGDRLGNPGSLGQLFELTEKGDVAERVGLA